MVYCINGGEPLQKGEAELISYWLQSIGLDVTIQSLEYATMARQMRRGDYDIARVQQGLPNGDPYSIFYTFMMPDAAAIRSAAWLTKIMRSQLYCRSQALHR